MYSASIGKLRGDEGVREDILQRVEHVREARTSILHLSESEVKSLLKEMVSIYDAIAAQLYATGRTKAVTNS